MDNSTKRILDDLKSSVEIAQDCNEDMNAVSWGMQEGVLISCNDAKLLIELIENNEYTSRCLGEILKTKN
jgi:hypothetical protein